MPAFKPVVFKTTRGYKFTVTCLNDVYKAMAMRWPNKLCEKYAEAARLIERAKQGWCTPRTAFEAFVKAAQAQGRLQESGRLRDRVVMELSTADLETLHPRSTPSQMRSQLGCGGGTLHARY